MPIPIISHPIFPSLPSRIPHQQAACINIICVYSYQQAIYRVVAEWESDDDNDDGGGGDVVGYDCCWV